ncbi:ATP-dependent DNA ligase [Mycolicibacterium fortuitum]|uniref:ATP-dependent DNA ligase n=1 Tax=Mycolicibacterium fortuitum TaxID=1766 RepID=UPI0007EB8B68|nr:ATP-dependent DNA ligase [Mycolicibacterium fortuitum]OBB30118.1 ATP-dependent DNA ligase [Mycolicibacterium fortuitum]OBB46469.1 ATP-dependent DNA ligase [Mycolicibacterium fortuitum]OBB66794.1 ATP-dependent DNA ligase [Mycolicibacterium fortuitum]OBF87673.1 ATP-dependent DNA ligase [Mycolicibacterium fortuitum]OBG16255.1 ATP-dependent DNA ligase [Mycolicibacterium fortuitum]
MERYERVRLTNPDKVLYPASSTTKAEVFDYYLSIAEVMLPHIAGRPVTRKRWPNGVAEASFFEKQLASSAPDWLERGTIVHKSGTTTYPIVNTREGLAWIAQQASLEVHVPQWRFSSDGSQGPATRIVFDLDPGEGVTMPQLCEVAQAVRELMSDIGLMTYPLTSGSKGLHLYVPLADPISSRGASVLAKRVAVQLEQAMPKLVTATMTRSLRAQKVFLDWSQNNAAKTTIAPYSLRGRDYPTVAAPRTWDEIGDPDLRHLRFDEVLQRISDDGDLLAGLDDDAPVADKLTTYRSMRDATKTPEPVPRDIPVRGNNDRFVIQEHHARRLHYDLRLERDGVLVSWAVPKNLPDTTAVNHLAVHTEDHPIEYLTFHGTIPKGEYGAGNMVIWDTGTYEAEKFRVPADPDDSDAPKGEVIFTLNGNRIDGRYALIQTEGKNWLAHRMKDQSSAAPEPKDFAPMLATEGSVDKLKATQWAFEGKWDGYRLLVEAEHGRLQLRSRRGRDVTAEYPQFEALAADLADHHVVLDGEAVALDDHGMPSFREMQNRARSTRVEFWAFDILWLDGRSLLRAKYTDRRKLLEALAAGGGLIVPEQLAGDGPEAMEHAREHKFEGVVAKKRDSTYQPGRRSASWIKDKIWNTQEVVIGGWRQGEGGRSSGIGALVLGVPGPHGLQFAGRVGTGFTEKELTKLKGMLKPLHTKESPFDKPLPKLDAKGVTFVRPELVGEVRYSERTTDHRLRQPSWRGLRPDKAPDEVVWE